MKLLESGKLWPIGVGIAITLVFCMGVGTIIVTSKADLQESDAYMTNYQNADIKANDFIKARIAFDKKYKLVYLTQQIKEGKCDVSYRLTDQNNKPVDGAKMVLAVSRPDTHKFDKKISNPVDKDGVYTFKDVKFSKAGVWDLILKVNIGNNYRFYSLKADTRKDQHKAVQEASSY